MDENSTVLPDKICKDLFMQALVRIQNHCKKVNMQNILKPCEIYFHHVIHSDLFPYICAKNRHLDAQLNKKILTANSDSVNLADLNLAPELKATLPGAKANLTLLMYLTSPAAKLDALDRLISLPSLQSKVTKHQKVEIKVDTMPAVWGLKFSRKGFTILLIFSINQHNQRKLLVL